MFVSIQPHWSQITTTTDLNLLSTSFLPRRSDLSGFSPCVVVAHVVAATVLFTEKLTQCFHQLEKTSQCPSSKGTSKCSLCCQLCHLKVLLLFRVQVTVPLLEVTTSKALMLDKTIETTSDQLQSATRV